MKRFIDVFFSVFLLILTLPILLLAIIGILISSGFPVFFIQPRVGQNNEIFSIYKLRTMSNSINNTNLHSVARITKWGSILRKLHIDELPQLVNILKGEMSFIGPRPLLIDYLPLYSEEQIKRHDVKPGLTGLAQINGRNAQNWHERFNWDLKYVKNQSFKLDCYIVWKTVKLLLRKPETNRTATIIMEPFKGEAEIKHDR